MANSAVAAKPAKKSGFKNTYLIAYNTVSAVTWLVVFWRGFLTYKYKGHGAVHAELGEFWTWTQTMALMEVLHALVGKLYFQVRVVARRSHVKSELY